MRPNWNADQNFNNSKCFHEKFFHLRSRNGARVLHSVWAQIFGLEKGQHVGENVVVDGGHVRSRKCPLAIGEDQDVIKGDGSGVQRHGNSTCRRIHDQKDVGRRESRRESLGVRKELCHGYYCLSCRKQRRQKRQTTVDMDLCRRSGSV